MSNLNGKVAVITGGSSGIGLATAKRFVAEGAHVFIFGRRQSELDKAKAAIGKNVSTVQGDVTNLADLDKLYAQVKAEKGLVDIVFANAGYIQHAQIFDLSEAHYDKTVGINLKGVVFTVQKALPLMTSRRLDHRHILDRRREGPSGSRYVLCHQGWRARPSPHLGPGAHQQKDSRQHSKPRGHRHPDYPQPVR